jgi:hypothetical protein
MPSNNNIKIHDPKLLFKFRNLLFSTSLSRVDLVKIFLDLTHQGRILLRCKYRAILHQLWASWLKTVLPSTYSYWVVILDLHLSIYLNHLIDSSSTRHLEYLVVKQFLDFPLPKFLNGLFRNLFRQIIKSLPFWLIPHLEFLVFPEDP